jgi:hypothetical protein
MFTNNKGKKKLSMCLVGVKARCLVLWGNEMMTGVKDITTKDTNRL